MFETFGQAVIREVKEETGLDINVRSLLWHVEEVSEERGQRFVNFFLAEATGGGLELGGDPEREAGGQVLREVRFMTREEIKGLENVYPEYLRDEFWRLPVKGATVYNSFKIRKN